MASTFGSGSRVAMLQVLGSCFEPMVLAGAVGAVVWCCGPGLEMWGEGPTWVGYIWDASSPQCWGPLRHHQPLWKEGTKKIVGGELPAPWGSVRGFQDPAPHVCFLQGCCCPLARPYWRTTILLTRSPSSSHGHQPSCVATFLLMWPPSSIHGHHPTLMDHHPPHVATILPAWPRVGHGGHQHLPSSGLWSGFWMPPSHFLGSQLFS